MSDWHVRSDCRLCGAKDLETVLELEPTPPANEFVKAEDPPQELIPLYLARCRDCGHIQLPVVVDPERLFRNYVYVSGTSPSFVQHFKNYAFDCIEAGKLQRDDLVVDVGSNDGTLLRFFMDAGMKVQGIDPAKAIAARATQAGVDTWPEFFTRETAQKVMWLHGKRTTLVVANNVFAHADDLRGIALAVKDLLDPDRGRFVFEVQYVVNLVENTLFDMVYHEHLSYHSLRPLMFFFHGLDMTLVDAELVDTHGGSIRCTVVPASGQPRSERLNDLLNAESDFFEDPTIWERMRKRMDFAEEELSRYLEGHAETGEVVAGYGAPAKLTTLCCQFGIDRELIEYIVDDSPWKQGLLAPGTRIPIVEPGRPWPDAFVIFAWNFAEPIKKKLRDAGFRGDIVVPLPSFSVSEGIPVRTKEIS